MKIAFLIVAHKDPSQLRRLVKHLTAEGDRCFIHIDRKTNSDPFRAALRDLSAAVHIMPNRQDIWWGGWGLVEAATTMMEAALADGADGFDRLVFLSEGCYPCRPLKDLKQRMAVTSEFMPIRRMSDAEPFMERYAQYHLMDAEALSPRGRTPTPIRMAAQALLRQFLTDERLSPPPFSHPVFFASTWWALSRAAATHIVSEMRNNAYWKQRFQYTRIPEEVVFSTIIGNSEFARHCVGTLHYLDWTANPGPKVLALEDYGRIVASGKFLTRKVDAEISSGLLDVLDARVQGRPEAEIEALLRRLRDDEAGEPLAPAPASEPAPPGQGTAAIDHPEAGGASPVAVARTPDDYQPPFFIVGCVRSGTTMLRNVLRRHPNLACPEETHFYRWSDPFGSPRFRAAVKELLLQEHRRIDQVEEAEFDQMLQESTSRVEMMRRYMALFASRTKPAARRWFDKTPQNIYGSMLLAGDLPQARFIHIVRDPVNVVASLRLGRVMKMADLNAACSHWNESITLVNGLKAVAPGRVLELRYEDFTAEPMKFLPTMLAFVGEAGFDPTVFNDLGLAAVSHREGPVLTPQEIERVETLCLSGRQQHGYAPAVQSPANPSPLRKHFSRLWKR